MRLTAIAMRPASVLAKICDAPCLVAELTGK